MTATPEQVDLASALVALANKIEKLPAKLRHHACGLIVGWASTEQADLLAEILEETARQVRLHRPGSVVNVR
jgi:hypothetical protein